MKTLLRSSYGAFCSLTRDVRDYLFWKQYNRHPNIHVLNYWRDQPLEHLWLYTHIHTDIHTCRADVARYV